MYFSQYWNQSSQAWKHFLFKSGPPDAFDPVQLSAIAETHDIISDSEDMKKIEEEINECLDKVSTYVSTYVYISKEIFTTHLHVHVCNYA